MCPMDQVVLLYDDNIEEVAEKTGRTVETLKKTLAFYKARKVYPVKVLVQPDVTQKEAWMSRDELQAKISEISKILESLKAEVSRVQIILNELYL